MNHLSINDIKLLNKPKCYESLLEILSFYI